MKNIWSFQISVLSYSYHCGFTLDNIWNISWVGQVTRIIALSPKLTIVQCLWVDNCHSVSTIVRQCERILFPHFCVLRVSFYVLFRIYGILRHNHFAIISQNMTKLTKLTKHVANNTMVTIVLFGPYKELVVSPMIIR